LYVCQALAASYGCPKKYSDGNLVLSKRRKVAIMLSEFPLREPGWRSGR